MAIALIALMPVTPPERKRDDDDRHHRQPDRKSPDIFTNALPMTMPEALNGVRNSRPRVPSRFFSDAMQSAVSAGNDGAEQRHQHRVQSG